MYKIQLLIMVFLFPILMAKGLPKADANSNGGAFNGTVTERMESGGYIYLNVKSDEESRWVATGSTAAKVGDVVNVPGAMEMRDFTSKTLDRTFPSIYFTGGVILEGDTPQSTEAQTLPQGHPTLPGGHPSIPSSPQVPKANTLPAGHPTIPSGSPAAAKPASVESLVKPEGYVSIAECYASRDKLEGQTVCIQGIVTKYSTNILGSNWVRIQDGTGEAGKDTLMVTTQDEAAIGRIVDVEGILNYDHDLGSGYLYPVIIKDAKLSMKELVDQENTGNPN